MTIHCVWEHHGNDSLLHAIHFIGAFTRGESLEIALQKMGSEIRSWANWLSLTLPPVENIQIVQDVASQLDIRDADSDVLFESEMPPLSMKEYQQQKAWALKSASDFLTLYQSIPDSSKTNLSPRKTFYGSAPCTAEEMYLHTKQVNDYYFGEIGVKSDHHGSILDCRLRGFEELEKHSDFLKNPTTVGSYGEAWNLRKVLRRFLWHDRIHAKAMYKMAVSLWGKDAIPNLFQFEVETTFDKQSKQRKR